MLKIKLHHFIKKHFYINRWNIGILKSPIANCLNGKIDNRDITWFPVLSGHQFMADPFVVSENGSLFLFYEFLDYSNKIGKIHFARINPSNFSVEETGEALSSSTHLSYPYVFKQGKDFYMVPESSASKEISLYIATRFPHQWKKIHTFFHLGGIDNTILFYNNQWWLFFTLSHYKEQALQELHLAFCDSLMGRWQLHPKNPVKIDRASSRPGGTPFIHEGNLFRPAQDCSKSYGGGVVINKILELNKNTFHEKRVAALSPVSSAPFPDGLHTLSHCNAGTFSIIDSLRLEFTPFKFVSTWKRRWFRFQQMLKKDEKL